MEWLAKKEVQQEVRGITLQFVMLKAVSVQALLLLYQKMEGLTFIHNSDQILVIESHELLL